MKTRHDHPLLALFWMIISGFAFSIMSVFVKSKANIPQFELVFFRSSVNCILVAGIILWKGQSFWPGKKLAPLLIFRGVAGFSSLSSLFYAIAHLPLSIAAMLNWSSPLFVILFSRIFLSERVPARAWVWAMVAVAGLWLLLRPDLGSSSWMALPMFPVAVGIFGAACGGMAYVAVRAATAQVGVNLIIFYFTLTATLLSLPELVLGGFQIPDFKSFIELTLIGVFGTIGQITMTLGYAAAAAGIVSTMSLMNAGFAALWGWVLFNETLTPIQWLGMAFLGLGIALVALSSGAMRRNSVKTSGNGP